MIGYISLVLLVMFVISIALLLTLKKKSKSIVLKIISVFLGVFLILNFLLYSHGAVTYSTPSNMFIHLINSPTNNNGLVYNKSEQNHLKNCIVVFYRFDCDDCSRTFNSIKDSLANVEVTSYWVSTRSEYGKELCHKYGVTSVPSLVSFNSSGEFRTYEIYSEESDNYLENSLLEEAKNFSKNN